MYNKKKQFTIKERYITMDIVICSQITCQPFCLSLKERWILLANYRASDPLVWQHAWNHMIQRIPHTAIQTYDSAVMKHGTYRSVIRAVKLL